MSSRVAIVVAARDTLVRVGVLRVVERTWIGWVVERVFTDDVALPVVRGAVVVRATTFVGVPIIGSAARFTTLLLRVFVAVRLTTADVLVAELRVVVELVAESERWRVVTVVVFVSRRTAARTASPMSSACAL